MELVCGGFLPMGGGGWQGGSWKRKEGGGGFWERGWQKNRQNTHVFIQSHNMVGGMGGRSGMNGNGNGRGGGLSRP